MPFFRKWLARSWPEHRTMRAEDAWVAWRIEETARSLRSCAIDCDFGLGGWTGRAAGAFRVQVERVAERLNENARFVEEWAEDVRRRPE